MGNSADQWWFWRGTQSAIFFYASCGPCSTARYQRKRRKEALRDKKEKEAMRMENPEIYHHPAPFETNPHWQEEITLGPGPPPRRARNRTRDSNNSAGTSGTITDGSVGGSLTDLAMQQVNGPLNTQRWNIRRYHRADEEYIEKIEEAGEVEAIQATSINGITMGIGGATIRKPERSYNAMRAPAVNDLHPPVVSIPPTEWQDRQWMKAPPPSAMFMNGKKGVTALNREGSRSSKEKEASSSGMDVGGSGSLYGVDRQGARWPRNNHAANISIDYDTDVHEQVFAAQRTSSWHNSARWPPHDYSEDSSPVVERSYNALRKRQSTQQTLQQQQQQRQQQQQQHRQLSQHRKQGSNSSTEEGSDYNHSSSDEENWPTGIRKPRPVHKKDLASRTSPQKRSKLPRGAHAGNIVNNTTTEDPVRIASPSITTTRTSKNRDDDIDLSSTSRPNRNLLYIPTSPHANVKRTRSHDRPRNLENIDTKGKGRSHVFPHNPSAGTTSPLPPQDSMEALDSSDINVASFPVEDASRHWSNYRKLSTDLNHMDGGYGGPAFTIYPGHRDAGIDRITTKQKRWSTEF